MFGMADMDPTGGLWNWAAGSSLPADRIHGALAGALERTVLPLGPDGTDGAVLCDVYLAPAGDELDAASAVAVRLGAAVLLPDDSLNPTRYVLSEPDGTRRAVHVDEIETDDGTERRNVRPCTGFDPACAVASERRAA